MPRQTEYGTTLTDCGDLRAGNAVHALQSQQISPNSERAPLSLINLG